MDILKKDPQYQGLLHKTLRLVNKTNITPKTFKIYHQLNNEEKIQISNSLVIITKYLARSVSLRQLASTQGFCFSNIRSQKDRLKRNTRLRNAT